jgi:hypothetical protein
LLIFAEDAALFQQAINQGRFAMINVGDKSDVANVVTG